MEKGAIIAVLENPNFMMNIGNVIRNVNGLGIEALYVIDGQNRLEEDLEAMRARKSLIRHSVGAILWTEVRTFESVKACFEALEAKGFKSIATSPHQKGKINSTLFDYEPQSPKLALWFGNEADGLSSEVIQNCESCIQIEMEGKVESFNLSTSSAIALYQIKRKITRNFPT